MEITVELMMALALWCGTATGSGYGQVTPDDVKKCRKEFVKCVKEYKELYPKKGKGAPEVCLY